MYYHPETMLQLANQTRQARYAEADRGRLLAAARRHRRSRRGHGTPARSTPAAGTLAECAPTAVPAG